MEQVEAWINLESLGYPNYQVSSKGRVVNINTRRFLSGYLNKLGYRKISLLSDGESKQIPIHRLMMMAFNPIPNMELYSVDHIDRIRDHNVLPNLRWADASMQALNRDIPKVRNTYRRINQFDLNGLYIKTWNSLREIELAGISKSYDITMACRGKRSTVNGFFWRYADITDLDNEIWSYIPYLDYAPLLVSNFGRVKRQNGQIVDGTDHGGYKKMMIYHLPTHKYVGVLVHRLVMATFVGINNELQVNHKDGNPSNNNLLNLEYVTASENVIHAIETGLRRRNTTPLRAVIATDHDGSIIRFESVKETATRCKLNPMTIVDICRDRAHTAKGLTFKYEDDASNCIDLPISTVKTEYEIILEIIQNPATNPDIASQWQSLTPLGFPEYYASSTGRILSMIKKCFMVPLVRGNFETVHLTNQTKDLKLCVHKIVAMIFLPIPNFSRFKVIHMDKDTRNNHVSNLQWVQKTTDTEIVPPLGITRPIYQFDLNWNFIAKWSSSSDIEKAGFGTRSNIARICTNLIVPAKGFIWRFADMDDLPNEIWENIPFPEYGTVKASNFGRIKYQNDQIISGYNLQVKLLNQETGVSTYIEIHRLIISTFLGRRDDMNIKHKDGNLGNNKLDNLEYVPPAVPLPIEERPRRIEPGQSRKVISIDCMGTQTVYDSTHIAAAQYNIHPSGIYKACSGKQKSAAGLRWMWQ